MEKENLTNIIQIAVSRSQTEGAMHSELVALCGDGSVWVKSDNYITGSKKWTLVNKGNMVLEEDKISEKK